MMAAGERAPPPVLRPDEAAAEEAATAAATRRSAAAAAAAPVWRARLPTATASVPALPSPAEFAALLALRSPAVSAELAVGTAAELAAPLVLRGGWNGARAERSRCWPERCCPAAIRVDRVFRLLVVEELLVVAAAWAAFDAALATTCPGNSSSTVFCSMAESFERLATIELATTGNGKGQGHL